jgi:hypothetical protein
MPAKKSVVLIWLRSLVLIVLGGVLGAPCVHAALPDPVVPHGFALQVKPERVTQEELQTIADLGFMYVRMAVWWDNVEFPGRGDRQWDATIHRLTPDPYLSDPMLTSFDGFVAQARQSGLKLLVTLYNGNRLYVGEPVAVTTPLGKTHQLLPGPRTPEQIAGFAAFAAATAKHYADRYGSDNFIWAIFNEPNLDSNFPPQFNPEVYGDVLQQSCQAIKAAVPGATVIGPDITVIQGKGDGQIDYDFIRRMLAHVNVLTCIDAFSFHPYRPTPPDTVVADYRTLKELLQPFMATAQRQIPLMVDEWGYTMRGKPLRFHYPGASPDRNLEQAALLARSFIVNLAAGVPLAVWYEWQDDGDDPQEGEHGYGLRDLAGQNKPSLKAAQTLIATLRGMVFDRQLAPPSCAATQLYLFRSQTPGRAYILAAWSDQSDASIAIKPQNLAGASVALLGQKSPLATSAEKTVFALDALPRYIPIMNLSDFAPHCPTRHSPP